MSHSEDVTLDAVACPACRGRSDAPPNDTVRGKCWVCLGVRQVTRKRAEEAERISLAESPPPPIARVSQLTRSRIGWSILAVSLFTLLFAWCTHFAP